MFELKSILDAGNQDARFRIYRDLWHKAQYYQVLTDFPMHLDIELSGLCNLKCQHCFQKLISDPPGHMKVELFKKIIDEGAEKGLCAAKLQIRGESFLHPQIFECIRYAKNAGIMDVQITTNGTILDEERIHAVLESGLDGIIFSVDPHHSESYEKQSSTRIYSTIETNIRNFLVQRTRLQKSLPWVRIQASIAQTDRESIQAAQTYIKEKFPVADRIVVNRLRNSHNDQDSYPDLHTNYKFLPCSYLVQRLAIFWNGDVTTCCMDYNGCFQLGNIENQTIQDIWLSTKMEQFRKTHIKGERKNMPICKHCHINTKRISDNSSDTHSNDSSQFISDYETLLARKML